MCSGCALSDHTGRGTGVGRTLGVGNGLGVAVGLGVGEGVVVGVGLGVWVAVALGVAVGVGVGVTPHGKYRATSSTYIAVSSPKPSWCTRNLIRTVCPAYGVMSTS
jgi:hypothetical protein